MQKAIVKGLIKYGNSHTTATYEPPQDEMIIEAESIEIINDEPKKREAKDGDISNTDDKIFVYGMGGNNESCWVIGKGHNFLFNLLEMVEEMKKVKDGQGNNSI